MIPVCVNVYECTKAEARNLPRGFQFLEYDSLYSSVRVMTAGENHVREDSRYVYLCYKEPPASFVGSKDGKSKLCAAARS